MRRSKRKSRPRSSLGCGECSRDFTAEHLNPWGRDVEQGVTSGFPSRIDRGMGAGESNPSFLCPHSPVFFIEVIREGPSDRERRDPMACGALRTLPENLFPGWPGRMRRRPRWMLWPPQVAPSTTITRSPRQDRHVQQGARTPSSASLFMTDSVVWAGKKMGGQKTGSFSCPHSPANDPSAPFCRSV
jgi:hypothetical protein